MSVTVILAMALSQVICHVTHVTIIESHIHTPYYHKLTEQQFGALAAIAVLSKTYYRLPIIFSVSCLKFSNIAHCFWIPIMLKKMPALFIWAYQLVQLGFSS